VRALTPRDPAAATLIVPLGVTSGETRMPALPEH
jgi:hypothetical protein